MSLFQKIRQHHFHRFEDSDIASEIRIGRAARNFRNLPVEAKTFSKDGRQPVREIFFEIAENTVELDTIDINVLRIVFQRNVDELQFVSAAALCKSALTVGKTHSVRFTADGKMQVVFFLPPTDKNTFEKSL